MLRMRWRDQSGPTRMPRPDQRRGAAAGVTSGPGSACWSIRCARPTRPRCWRASPRSPTGATWTSSCSRAACWARRAATASTATSSSTCATSAASTASSSWAARWGTSTARRPWPSCARASRRCRWRASPSRRPASPACSSTRRPGMRQALEHLVVRHGCRRIAFIRGPSVNAEAEHRYAIYRQVLEERGLQFDPNLVCEGTFEKAAGEAAVELLVDERKVQFDGLVGGERLHGAGRDPGAAGARPAGAVRRRGRRLRRHRGRAVLDAAADHRAPAAVSAGRGGPRPRAGADRRRGGRAADDRRHRAGRAPVVRLSVRPDPSRPRRHRDADADRAREPPRRARRRRRPPDRARRPRRRHRAAAGLGPPAARRLRGGAARRRRGSVRVDAGPPARQRRRRPATTSAPGRG